MTSEEMENLILLKKDGIDRLDPDRKGRANTTFAFASILPTLAEMMAFGVENGDQTLQFPKDSQQFSGQMTLAKSKWPSHDQQDVLFDLREKIQEDSDVLNVAFNSFSQENAIWGDMTSLP